MLFGTCGIIKKATLFDTHLGRYPTVNLSLVSNFDKSAECAKYHHNVAGRQSYDRPAWSIFGDETIETTWTDQVIKELHTDSSHLSKYVSLKPLGQVAHSNIWPIKSFRTEAAGAVVLHCCRMGPCAPRLESLCSPSCSWVCPLTVGGDW